ncbi:Protein cubitus interruptus [Camponotus floridanus]|uniref:Protein cubitus interruptus n=1 Tax=Camponotus floridanus TaxID=104421 RepID=E2AB01_CAMFO|nr:Protein cubitus interruptus [Camponotus floridanus]
MVAGGMESQQQQVLAPTTRNRLKGRLNAKANQCYHDQHGSLPKIQCRDISQSQQGSPVKPPQGMRHDSYRRTLEYVQQCKNWSGNAQTHETNVSSSTHPISLPQPLPASANMVVNDMTSSLSSLLEENRYLQMIQ